MNIYTDTRLAWAAGIIDGEGSIFIQRCKPSRYTLRLSVRMCCQDTVSKLAEILGGRCIELKRRTKSGKIVYSWGATQHKAVAILEKIEHFSITKKYQISTAKDYTQHLSEGEKYYHIMGELNK